MRFTQSYWKAVDVVGMSPLTRLFSNVQRLGTVNWSGGPEGVFQLRGGGSHSTASPGMSTPQYWKGGSVC